MTTATAIATTHGLTVRVEVQANARSLGADAQRAADAAAARLATMLPTRPIAELREEYRAALEGETQTDCEDTQYGRLIAALVSAADVAATEGWHNPDGAFVTVDVDAA